MRINGSVIGSVVTSSASSAIGVWDIRNLEIANRLGLWPNPVDVVTSGLILYLDAGNLSSYPGSGTTWTDLSGNGNNLTLTNGPTYTTNNGGSLIFDGTNDYAGLASISSFNAYSISIWFKPTTTVNSTSTFKVLFQLRTGSGNDNKYICFGSATSLLTDEYITFIDATNDTRTGITDGGSLSAGSWYNLVFNYESSQYKMYINNVLKTTSTANGGVPLITNPNCVYINCYQGALYFADNTLSTCAIYNRTLSSTELNQNFNAIRTRYGI